MLSRYDIDTPGGQTVDLLQAEHVAPSPGHTVDEVEAAEARVLALAAQVDADADRVEQVVGDLDDPPSFVLIFENGLV